jgi:hypothetical protein
LLSLKPSYVGGRHNIANTHGVYLIFAILPVIRAWVIVLVADSPLDRSTSDKIGLRRHAVLNFADQNRITGPV